MRREVITGISPYLNLNQLSNFLLCPNPSVSPMCTVPTGPVLPVGWGNKSTGSASCSTAAQISLQSCEGIIWGKRHDWTPTAVSAAHPKEEDTANVFLKMMFYTEKAFIPKNLKVDLDNGISFPVPGRV